MKKVTTRKDFIADIKKIIRDKKDNSIFHYYVKQDLFVVSVNTTKYIFNFEDYRSEKTIIQLIEAAIKLLNKSYFLQLDAIEGKQIKINR